MTIATRFCNRKGQRRLCAIAALSCWPGVLELPRALVGLSVPSCDNAAPPSLPAAGAAKAWIYAIDVDAIGYCHHSASFLSLVLPRAVPCAESTQPYDSVSKWPSHGSAARESDA